MPWLCLLAATNASFADAHSRVDGVAGTEDYREGAYFKALQGFSKQNKYLPVENYYLGRMNLYGYGQLKNNAKAIRYLSQAAEGGFLPAQEIMALYALIEKNDPVQALYWYKKAADANYLPAQMYCASAYLFGFGVQKNPDKARQYYIGAARQGNSIAQYALAENFLESRQASSKQLGLLWLDKAVVQKNPRAQLLLGQLYASGKAVPMDMAKATQLIDEAVASGFAPAMVQKGDMALQQKDWTSAKTWYTKAIDAGYYPANLALGQLYLDEKTPLFDAHAGYLLILQAAQNEWPAAQLALASLLKEGKGIEANPAVAEEWQKKAANNTLNRPEVKAASWLSNGRAHDFAASGYQLKGIFNNWTSARAHQQNLYNASPQMSVVTRDTLYKPNFVLTSPDEIEIDAYLDALVSSLKTATVDSFTFAAYPLDAQLVSLKNLLNKKEGKKVEEIVSKMQLEASLGDSKAEYDLGQMYQFGLGVKPDMQAALQNYALAAGQEELAAMYALGITYIEGKNGIQADHAKGLDWLRQAAFKGNGYAQFALARVYEQGLKNPEGKLVIAPDAQQADGMYFLAAANDNGLAQYRLAEILVRRKQDDVSVSAKQKRQVLIKSLYQTAFSNGIVDAALPLAYFNAMDSDKAKQKEAFETAKQEVGSTTGHANAALLLGLMYDRGIGTKVSRNEAIYWYQQAGDNLVSNFILGTYYSLGQGVDEDLNKGRKLLEAASKADFSYAHLNLAVLNHKQDKAFLPELDKALASGNSKAGLLLADYYLSLASTPLQMKQAHDIYQLFADKGDKEAQLKLAYMIEQGIGGKVDYQQASTWYTASAEQGQPVAQYLLGRLYQLGRLEVLPNYTLAKQWYSQAQSSYAPAAIALGFIYDTVDDDYQQAQTSYSIAAGLQSPIGQFDMGLMYEEGKGQAVDLEKAKGFYQAAMNQGHVASMVRLAGIYFNEISTGGDPQEALRLYQKAAEKGSREALYQLGLLSETGIAIPLDLPKALGYYEKAAQLGQQQGMLAAARMYQYGVGVSQNNKQAATYYEMLAGLGNAFAQYQLAKLYDNKVLSEAKPGEGKKWMDEALKNGSLQAEKTVNWLAVQKQKELSFVEPVVFNSVQDIVDKPVELMYLDALNQWNCGDELRSKIIFDRIRVQYPNYKPAKRAYDKMILG